MNKHSFSTYHVSRIRVLVMNDSPHRLLSPLLRCQPFSVFSLRIPWCAPFFKISKLSSKLSPTSVCVPPIPVPPLYPHYLPPQIIHHITVRLISILCWFHHHHSLLNNLQWFPIIHRMKYNSVVWHWRLSTLLSPLWVTLASLLPYVNSWLECVRLFTDPQKAHLEPRSYLHALVLAIRSPEMPANHTVLYLSCPSFRLTSAWPFGASSLTAPVLCDYFPFLYFITHFLKTTHLGLRIFLYY